MKFLFKLQLIFVIFIYTSYLGSCTDPKKITSNSVVFNWDIMFDEKPSANNKILQEVGFNIKKYLFINGVTDTSKIKISWNPSIDNKSQYKAIGTCGTCTGKGGVNPPNIPCPKSNFLGSNVSSVKCMTSTHLH